MVSGVSAPAGAPQKPPTTIIKASEDHTEQSESVYTPQSKEETITILGYNTHLFGLYGDPFTRGSQYKDDERAKRICEALMKSNADVVVLSEVWDDKLAQGLIVCKKDIQILLDL